ncbi:polysaccharide biosynthesis protein [Nocardioides sp. YIM 152315]|uniref:polysaccharide biosynthesis protein n=1 Tax=Nocardioides sp. YIM 152315 TaxID=3031760 RepID=UPI0023D9BCD8|nr:polysaccharide biosynthesis protein [Nocardioides sp. YIM 152315]MDF1603447.1 polysaccharide biosynthesis protein [Nocardioides sp. YIM 152315]
MNPVHTARRPVGRTARLAREVVRRQDSLLRPDLDSHAERMADEVRGERVLVVGGAGSIGSATVAELARLRPRQLHVVDTDENGLTELVRDLRNRDLVRAETELRTTPMDAGCPSMLRLITENGGYDRVLNFAAVKHVRSEKDVYSLLRMLEINVRLPRRLLEWVGGSTRRYFAVSTDKAANPVNLMGASKRAMEHVILDEQLGPEVTSARFANVAFSQGSLLDGWLRRMDKGQAWAVPRDTRRYFVTLEESGHLCTLAAVLGRPGEVVIPHLDPRTELRDLVEVAEDVLGSLGLRPNFCEEEDEARRSAADPAPGTWPVLLTDLDTTGEKEFEEFAAPGDVVGDAGFTALRSLRAPRTHSELIGSALRALAGWLDDPTAPVDEEDVADLLRTLVPELQHRGSARGLDARM